MDGVPTGPRFSSSPCRGGVHVKLQNDEMCSADGANLHFGMPYRALHGHEGLEKLHDVWLGVLSNAAKENGPVLVANPCCAVAKKDKEGMVV